MLPSITYISQQANLNSEKVQNCWKILAQLFGLVLYLKTYIHILIIYYNSSL